MKKVIILFLAVSVLVMGSAQAGIVNGLQSAFDEYYYALTVQWDQNDLAAKKTIDDTLLSRLNELKDQGMSKEDVLEFLESRPQSREFADNLRSRLALADLNSMSKAEVLGLFSEAAGQTYQRGVNWLGMNDGLTVVFVAIGVTAFAVLGLWATGVIGCSQERYCFGGYDCERRFVCN